MLGPTAISQTLPNLQPIDYATYAWEKISSNITLADILTNSVHPSIVPNGHDGQGVSAIFEPQLGFSLSQTIALANSTLGTSFTHFNWIQYLGAITYPSYSDLYNLYLPIEGGNQAEASAEANSFLSFIPSLRGIGYDPLLGGNPNPTNSPFAPCVGDNSIAYWDETPKTCANGTDNNEYLVSSNTIGDGQLSFLDYPDQDIPLTQLSFEDVLAGVDAFGNVTPLYYPGTAFTWTYLQGLNDSSMPNLFLYGNIDPSLGGTGSVTSLEFTDAQIPTATVPEPATLTLLGIAALFTLPLRRRRT